VSASRFAVVENKQTHLVVERVSRRVLGGVVVNHYRPSVFPLYTPSGHTVLQESPPDHPFHSGFFVGQNDVEAGGRQANFWATPPARMADDPLQLRVGRMAVESPPEVRAEEDWIELELTSVWRDEHEKPVLDEVRTVRFALRDGATVCDMWSRKTASYEPVRFGATKHGSIGIRVEPRLLPMLGGEVIGDRGRRGHPDLLHEEESGYIAYENEVTPSGRVGVLMSTLPDSARGTWFIRDYGMAMYDATLRSAVSLDAGDSWTVALRVTAYEGPLTEERAELYTRP
jgi:hypothetical protein